MRANFISRIVPCHLSRETEVSKELKMKEAISGIVVLLMLVVGATLFMISKLVSDDALSAGLLFFGVALMSIGMIDCVFSGSIKASRSMSCQKPRSLSSNEDTDGE